MADLRALLSDPDFHALPTDRQRAVALDVEPELAKLPADAQGRVLFEAAPDQWYGAAEKRYGLPEGLLGSIGFIESSHGKNTLSKTRVRGHMQITGATGKAYGLDPNTPDFVDPVRQIDTAGKIMQGNLKQAGGDLRKAVALYGDHADLGYAERVLSRMMAGQPKQLQPTEAQAQAPATTTTPSSAAAAAAAPESFGNALMNSLARSGERQIEAVGDLGQAGRELITAPGLVPLGRTALAGLRAAQPLYAPSMTLGEVVGETAARTGMVPVSPETGALVGSLIPAGVQALPSLIRGGAKLLSPSLRVAERAAAEGAAKSAAANKAAQEALAARRAEQGAAGIAQAGQMAARGPAGAEAGVVTRDIANRLQAEAGTKAAAAQSAQRATVPSATLKQERVLARTPAQDIDPITGKLKPARGPKGQFATPPKPLTEADYGKTFTTLRKESQAAGQAAIDFDRAVTNKLSKLGPSKITQTLARDADVMAAIAAHATPAEMQIIQRAVEAGKPLSQMPYTADQLQDIGRIVIEGTRSQGGRGFFSPLTAMGLGAGTVGAFINLPVSAAGTATLIIGRLALKAADAALGSKAGVEAMRQLSRLAPGSPEAMRIIASVGSQVTTPTRLQPPSR